VLWVAIWVGLVLFAIAVVGLLGWSLWRRGKALFTEIGQAGDRFSQVSVRLQAVSVERQLPELAVFSDPATLRQQATARKARHRAGQA
jgi:predicted negative regulator of RcsB-dependent stress response